MLCRVAELILEIPEAGGMAPRCREYLCRFEANPDITIRSEYYSAENWPSLSYEDMAYMESARQFHSMLLNYNGLYLHASAVELNGKAYLFSGPCGTGKSTHTRLWQQTFGPAAQVFNDDKPALRRLNGTWFAYGTPWCGKDGINQNKKVPLAGICFLKQGPENAIRQLTASEALTRAFSQTLHNFSRSARLDLMLSHMDNLVREIPIFELENRPEPEAAQLSYETMLRAAQEAGL